MVVVKWLCGGGDMAPGGVVEVAGSDRLPHGHRVVVAGHDLYLHPLQQRLQLVPEGGQQSSLVVIKVSITMEDQRHHHW